MKSAFECFQSAARFELRASVAIDIADKATFLGLAKHWRTLGDIAQRIDRQEIIGLSPKPAQLRDVRGELDGAGGTSRTGDHYQMDGVPDRHASPGRRRKRLPNDDGAIA